MSKMISAADLQPASNKLLRLIVEESDKRVAAQAKVMIAADARANGILAAATALAAAGFAVAADQLSNKEGTILFIAAALFACTATIAAMAAVWSLWPGPLNVQGWSPRLFVNDIKQSKMEKEVLREFACLNQEKISENDHLNRILSGRIKVSMLLLAVSPIVGAIGAAFSAGFPYAVGGGFLFPVAMGILMLISKELQRL